MSQQTFSVILEPAFAGSTSAGCFIVPFSVPDIFGTKAMVNVRGTINGTPFRSCLMPDGKGNHYMGVKKALRLQAGAELGSSVTIVMELDPEQKTVTTPEDVLAALDSVPEARAAYEALAKSHKREYVEWIASAKKPETRSRRIDQMVRRLTGEEAQG